MFAVAAGARSPLRLHSFSLFRTRQDQREFPKLRGTFKGIHMGFLKGIYQVSIKGLGFRVSENKGYLNLFWGPYNMGPSS